ncbi:porin family protein [Winogradskyella ursingii]|uniref:tRNA modification GTPase n=1 Tax=Winogradskyella ursingii TaxID=2686079 RepID=UPI0015CDA43F|nr:tRNA modification GTPase [Winogradskyella ursingii]
MKKKLTLIIAIVCCINSYSQITFEKGYFVTNSGDKTECLIKNEDWANNPKSFQYKLSKNDEIETKKIESVKEFGIINTSKYLRSTVEIDRSGDISGNFDESRNPKFRTEQLFLKVLVEGKASLYVYNEGNLERFFYNLNSSDIEQLIYKRYKTDDGKIAENVRFKQQLLNDLLCEDLNFNRIENLKYKKNSLVSLFVDYNSCKNVTITNFQENTHKGLFNLILKPGLGNSSLEYTSISSIGNFTFKDDLNFKFGVEFEFVLPFNNSKWAIFAEPTYQSFNSEDIRVTNSTNPREISVSAEYTSIEIPLGIKHYFFLSNSSKIFINAAFVFDYNLDTSFKSDGVERFSAKEFHSNASVGTGYKLDDKYSLELRYHFNRTLSGNGATTKAKFTNISLFLGYTIF